MTINNRKSRKPRGIAVTTKACPACAGEITYLHRPPVCANTAGRGWASITPAA